MLCRSSYICRLRKNINFVVLHICDTKLLSFKNGKGRTCNRIMIFCLHKNGPAALFLKSSSCRWINWMIIGIFHMRVTTALSLISSALRHDNWKSIAVLYRRARTSLFLICSAVCFTIRWAFQYCTCLLQNQCPSNLQRLDDAFLYSLVYLLCSHLDEVHNCATVTYSVSSFCVVRTLIWSSINCTVALQLLSN